MARTGSSSGMFFHGLVRLMVALACLYMSANCSSPANSEFIISDFESDECLDAIDWKCFTLFSLSQEHASHGTRSLRMELFPSDYLQFPGFIPILKKTDWRGYDNLRLDIYNPQEADISVQVRIDDRKDAEDFAESFVEGFSLRPGWNTIHVPLGRLVTVSQKRSLNVGRIYGFSLFMRDLRERTVLYLDYMRLSGT